MRVAVDTNVLVYVEGLNGVGRQTDAQAVFDRLSPADVVLPVQVLSELFFVLVRKAKWPAVRARSKVLDWLDAYDQIATDFLILADAMTLVADHRIAWWDAIVMASAFAAECELLLSEDFQHGFTWRDVRVENPFRIEP